MNETPKFLTRLNSQLPSIPQRFSALLTICFPALAAMLMNCQSEAEIKRQRYITEGMQLYQTYCANCHQRDGKGLAALYPPIAGSDYLKNKNKVICLIRYGQQGPIVVNGQRYNRPMPAQPQLSDLEVAEIATYIYNKWGDEKTVTDVASARQVLQQCAPQPVQGH